MIRVREILYPTDFSSFSNQAYFHAVSLAENHQARLTVLFVLTPECPAPKGRDCRTHWKEQLGQIRPLNPRIAVRHVLLEGDPADEIVRYARESSIDVIVMGTHGRTGMERLLMGSVAEKVLRDAPCTVLVAKMPRGASAVKADLEVRVGA